MLAQNYIEALDTSSFLSDKRAALGTRMDINPVRSAMLVFEVFVEVKVSHDWLTAMCLFIVTCVLTAT